jgi:transposase
MMTSGQARAIYLAGEETVVRTLLEMDARMDALEARIAAITGTFETQVRDLTVRLEVSEKRVKHLEDQLAKNSRNSGKPPSSNGFNRPAPKSLREKSGRPTGGQPGHPGSALSMVTDPDRIEIHPAPDTCTECGKPLAVRPVESFERRQVHDLPPRRMVVTEHRAEAKACTCGCLNTAPFPPGVSAPVQYGPGVKSAAVYLKNFQLLPYERACELLADLFGCKISEGTLANILTECGKLLMQPVAKIKGLIVGAPVGHFDETGSRVDKLLWWIHVASTTNATVYDINPKRGSEAMDAMGILPAFSGRAIHDHWKPYMGYACAHGFCNAHHLRELTFAHEQDHQPWAKSMITCLIDMKAVVDKARPTAKSLTQFQVRMFRRRYHAIIEEGYLQNPRASTPAHKRGQAKQTKSRNLIERLDKHRSQVLAFMTDFTVPFSNNLAERDVRMIKVQQKISGPFRSVDGAKTFCRIRSYISTARKNAIATFDAIQRVFTGTPFVPVANTS